MFMGDPLNLNERYPPSDRGTIVVWGLMGNSPFGGMIWQVYHYLVPLRKLGFDVWYVEDTDEFSYDPVTFMPTWDPTENAKLLDQFMRRIGLADRWIVRVPSTEECLGAKDHSGLLQLYRDADAAINLCGAQEPRESHREIPCRIYVETDPVKNQVAVANGDQACIEMLRQFDHLFTYGENLGQPDCPVPIERFQWLKTRPPVVVPWWQTNEPPRADASLTSVANWKHSGKDVVWKGETWRWSKHHEFLKFIGLPRTAKLPMELAVGAIEQQDRERLKDNGWQLRSSAALQDPDAYRQYIRESAGEFTVAKEQYVRPRSGWFSDRSVCYLASGRPVITQDTAIGNFVPTGEGLFVYQTPEQANDAIEAVATNYQQHCSAALEIANEYFAAQRVVGDMMQTIGLM